LPCGDRRHENSATGRTSRPLKIIHWNAESVNSKKDKYSKKIKYNEANPMAKRNNIEKKNLHILCELLKTVKFIQETTLQI
jgi:hypothetical protein